MKKLLIIMLMMAFVMPNDAFAQKRKEKKASAKATTQSRLALLDARSNLAQQFEVMVNGMQYFMELRFVQAIPLLKKHPLRI